MEAKFFVLLLALLSYSADATERLQFSNIDIFEKLHHEPPLPPGADNVISASIEEKWITQPLDHFNIFNKKKWQMRYYERSDFYRPGGPLCIFIGGEWAIHPAWLQTGTFYETCRELGGWLIYTEHRYYGESRPTQDTSTSNLQYLTVDQALADLRYIVDVFRKSLGIRTKVIAAGGSYAGTMAAWFRYAYPLHCQAAWAACAPIEAKADFYRYKEIVGHAYREEGGQECYDVLEDGFNGLIELMEKNETATIEEEFQFCHPLDASNKLDVTNFFYGVQNLLSGQVQSAKPGSIKSLCDYMTHPFWETPVQALGGFFTLAYGNACYSHHFINNILYGTPTNWEASCNQNGYRTWFYQTCDQFGWFQTTGSDNQPYGDTVPADFSIEICRQTYGNKYNRFSVPLHIAVTNIKYQGMNVNQTNIYWTHGGFDPWHGAGIVEANNEDSPVDVIPGAAHTNELLSAYDTDTVEMAAAKRRAKSLLIKWVEQ